MGETDSHLNTCVFSTFCICISHWIHQEHVPPTLKQHFCIFAASAAKPPPCLEFSAAAGAFPPSFTLLASPCISGPLLWPWDTAQPANFIKTISPAVRTSGTLNSTDFRNGPELGNLLVFKQESVSSERAVKGLGRLT